MFRKCDVWGNLCPAAQDSLLMELIFLVVYGFLILTILVDSSKKWQEKGVDFAFKTQCSKETWYTPRLSH